MFGLLSLKGVRNQLEGKQLELMRVIEFPKNREIKQKTLKDKQKVAELLIDFLTDEECDFHIVISRKSAEKLFEMDGYKGDKVILTSNHKEAKQILPELKKGIFYLLTGDEF